MDELKQNIVDAFKQLDNVEAIIQAGSHTTGLLDHHSDIDIYIISEKILPASIRKEIIVSLGPSKADLDLTYWDNGDEWVHKKTEIEVDMIYWEMDWIETQLSNVIDHHQASLGYTTCFWRTVKQATLLYDRSSWFSELQERTAKPYPVALKKAIIQKNHPVVRKIIPSYYNQILKAIHRKDIISINHRLSVLLASYFDIVFAVNEILHPGEKKILNCVTNECNHIPEKLEYHLERIFILSGNGDSELLEVLTEMMDGLDNLLVIHGFF